MCGKRWFPFVAASVGAIFSIDAVIALFAEAGVVNTWWALALVIVLALATGILVGIVLRRRIWVAVTIVGAIAGGIAGAYLFEFIVAIWAVQSALALLLCAIGFAIIGGVLAQKFGAYIVIFGTSLIGSYAFMRGWSVLFGGYPTEPELVVMFQSGEPVELDSSFYIYFAVLLVTFCFTSFWQFGKDLQHHQDVHDAFID